MSDDTLTKSVAVSLENLLAAKDRRAARQRELLVRYSATLVSLTLVTPGPVKDSTLYRQAMHEAVSAFDALCRARGWSVLEHQLHWLETGAEGFWVVKKDALSVKAAAIALEEHHALGRLWDFDVFCPQEGSIGRSLLAHAGRSCMLCGEPAHACARSRRHPLPELIQQIEGMLHAYFDPH